MSGGINLATKYSREISERWEAASQISLISNRFYDFKGDRTVVVYSIPYAPLNDYQRSGMSRYGTPNDLGRNVQTLTVAQDKGFNFIIDRGDEVQSEYVSNPGSALDREIREVIVPAFDTYCFKVMANNAVAHGNNSITVINKTNAHEMLLNGIQHLSDRNVPLDGCVAYCTFSFVNFLMQDSSFMRYGDRSQEMIQKGVIGMADGITIVTVSPNRLPAGAAFLLAHKDAIVAPKQLEEYKTHVDPPGISGTLCEGRVLFDCFVLNEKSDGIYYHGGQSALKQLRFMTTAAGNGKCKIIMNCEKEKSGNTWYAKTALDQSALPAVSFTTAIDPASGAWSGAFAVTGKEFEFTPTSGHTRIRIAEVGSNSKPVAYADYDINVET